MMGRVHSILALYGSTCAACVALLWSHIKFQWMSDDFVITAMMMIVFGLPIFAAFEVLWLAVSRVWRWMREGRT